MIKHLSSDYPRWEGLCTVQAFCIGQISHAPDGAALSPSDARYASVLVNPAWLQEHRPTTGGYYVMDTAGVATFMGKEPFEELYTLEGQHQ